MAVTTGRFCWRPKRISIAQFASVTIYSYLNEMKGAAEEA
jgi:hypothetical protein